MWKSIHTKGAHVWILYKINIQNAKLCSIWKRSQQNILLKCHQSWGWAQRFNWSIGISYYAVCTPGTAGREPVLTQPPGTNLREIQVQAGEGTLRGGVEARNIQRKTQRLETRQCWSSESKCRVATSSVGESRPNIFTLGGSNINSWTVRVVGKRQLKQE